MSVPTLAERMVALRVKEIVADPSTRSDSQEQSTLATFLTLYTKAPSWYYKEYMKGAGYLLRWLTPIGWDARFCPLDLEVDKYPRINALSFKADRVLSSYDAGELAKLITGSYMNRSVDFGAYMLEEARIRRAICLTMIDLINKEIL